MGATATKTNLAVVPYSTTNMVGKTQEADTCETSLKCYDTNKSHMNNIWVSMTKKKPPWQKQ